MHRTTPERQSLGSLIKTWSVDDDGDDGEEVKGLHVQIAPKPATPTVTTQMSLYDGMRKGKGAPIPLYNHLKVNTWTILLLSSFLPFSQRQGSSAKFPSLSMSHNNIWQWMTRSPFEGKMQITGEKVITRVLGLIYAPCILHQHPCASLEHSLSNSSAAPYDPFFNRSFIILVLLGKLKLNNLGELVFEHSFTNNLFNQKANSEKFPFGPGPSNRGRSDWLLGMQNCGG